MSNEELIKALRHCGEDVVVHCNDCPLFGECDSFEYPMLHAADALEAAEKRIVKLEADKKQLINVIKDKSDFHATKDAMRIAYLEAQLPKEGEWIKSDDGMTVCSNCGLVLEDWIQGIFYNFCPNCGAKMNGKENNDADS